MPGPRLLVINGYYPSPDVDSGSVSITNFMRMALSLGFQVSHMVPGKFADAATEERARLEAIGVRTIGAPHHRSPEAFLQSHGARFAVIVLSGYLVGADFYRVVRKYCPQARIVFNAVDMHHLRYERQANVTGSAAALQVAAEARKHELFLIRNCDATILVSDAELRRMREALPGASIYHVPLIRDVPGRINGFAERKDIGFIGYYRHPPNPDAAMVFAGGVWPKVHAALPDAHFQMIGSSWPEPLTLPAGDNIDFVGHVADIGAKLEELRLTVAPLRFGAGAKGKVVSSLAHGVPCVASPIAAEGMGLTDGVDILIASDPHSFADRVVALYSDASLWNRISDAGLAFVKKNHSFEHGTQLVRRLMSDIGVLRGGAG